MSGRFYADATQRNPDMKNAVYLKGITPPVWVASNPDIAAFAVRRLNTADAAGRLRGWSYMSPNSFGTPVRKRGWSVDDLLSAARGGELSADAIREAGTLLQAIATVANGKERR